MNKIKFVAQSHINPMPESATLMELCAITKTGVSQVEKDGHVMIFAYFNIDGTGYLYQDGDSVATKHLFFLLTYLPYKLNHSKILDEVNSIFGGGFIDAN